MEVFVPTKPEPIKLDINRAALIVVDMQNAFCKKGGMFDVLGMFDEAMAKRVIETDKKVIEASRHQGIKIIYLRMAYRPGLSNAGGPEPHTSWKERELE